MPLNTRVGRCVTKLRNKYGYGKAIGICQHSTKQNYLTGETMRKKLGHRKTKRGGVRPGLRLKTHMGKRYVMKVDNNKQPVLGKKGMIELFDYNAAKTRALLIKKKDIPSYKNPQDGSGKKTRRRKKRGGQSSPTWIIKATPAAVHKFRTKIFNSPKYISVEDEEAADIMDYISVEAETNDDDGRWFMMKFDEGSWYPGEEPTYNKSISECSLPCYHVDSTGIRPILTRQTSHGSQKKGRKTRRRRRKHKRTRRRKRRR